MSNVATTISIIVPVYNEEAVLPLFFEEISAVLKPLNIVYEILFIDDGSRDKTETILLALKSYNPEIAFVKFSRNFGKEAAMSAGLKLCKGEAAIIIDVDLQDPPALIPDMLEAWKSGADVVNMKRLIRHGEPAWKIQTANLFYSTMSKISEIEIPQNVGDFRLFSRCVINSLNQLNERGRFMKGLFAWVGYSQTTIHYERDARMAGNTKWSFLKLTRFAWQGITAFSTAPLKIATWLGLMSASVAFFYAAYFLIKSLLIGDDVQGFPTLVTIILFLGGLQLFCIGIMGEYIARIYNEVKQRPIYLVENFHPSNTL